MLKRLFDIVFSILAIGVTLPIIVAASLLIWAEDGYWPFYRGVRVGRGGHDFRMLKLRTMAPGGERLGGSSTAASDARLTRVGGAIRRWKIDELPQFWNVLAGEMSVVGPRPNVRRGGIDAYTGEESRLLSLHPGITDLASIVFADEGEILKGCSNPDAHYDEVIRPWKNRLALLYLEHRSMTADLRLIGLTVMNLLSRRAALRGVERMLEDWSASAELKQICRRAAPLPAGLPPGEIA